MLKLLKNHFYIFGIICAIVALIIFPKWTVDDAFITCRYADNLANHSELTWNVGEDPTEGYTGILLPLMLALCIKLGISPILAAKVFGVISFILGGYILYLIMKLIRIRPSASSVIIIIYCCAPFMFVHAYSGLETMMFIMLILLCIYLFFQRTASENRKHNLEYKLIITLIILSLTRPEGVILAACILLALGINIWKYDKSGVFKYVIKVLGIFVLPCLIYFIWRWQYYGFFLPNTFYAKGGEGLIDKGSVLRLILFTILFISIPTIVIIILNLSGFKTVKNYIRQESSLKSPQFMIALIAIVLFCAIVLLRYMQSRLLMNYEFRFYVPFFPIFLIFAAIFLDSGFATMQNLKKSKKFIFWILFVFALFFTSFQAYIYLKQFGKYIFLKAGYQAMIESEHIPAGKFIKDTVPADEWVNVIHDVGAIPYYSERKIVDFSRLNNETLARTRMNEKEVTDYFFSFNPGAVVLTSYDWDNVTQPWYYGDESKMISEDPRFKKYVLVKKYRTDITEEHPAHYYYEFLYLREDLVK